MTVDDWPTLCQGKGCKRTATPATWVFVLGPQWRKYYCQRHMQRLYNLGWNKPQQWVKLTPNQRPSPVQEVQSGSYDQGQNEPGH